VEETFFEEGRGGPTGKECRTAQEHISFFLQWTLLAGYGFRAGTKPHRCFCHYQTGHTQNRNTHLLLALCVLKRDSPVSVLISAGRSAVHTMPPIPAPVHLSCRCFLSV